MDFVPHAVTEFITRFWPKAEYDVALMHLESESAHATKLPERTLAGQEQWQIDDPPCVLVVKRDKATGRGRASKFKGDDRVCVTIVPCHRQTNPEEVEP